MKTIPPVVVIGSGLAGLSCAVRLHQVGLPVVVLEAGDGIGGRVRTDIVDGFTIDRGFQVLNTGYPALKSAVDLAALDLRHLPRGVRVRRDGQIHDVTHPFASPIAPVRALTSGALGLRGKIALARYAASLLSSSSAAIKGRPDISAEEAWSEVIGDDVISGVLVPFLSGVVLEETISTSRVFTDLMMRMFATGSSAVPARGMQALPDLLAARLPEDAVTLHARVTDVGSHMVALHDGTTLDATAVVVATDPWTAHELVPDLGPPPRSRGVTTYYFAVASATQLDGTLVVDADRSGITNSVVLTASAPEYSTDGRSLIATSVLNSEDGPVRSAAEAGAHAAELHGLSVNGFELVTTRDVPRALPAMPAPHPLRKPVFQPGAQVWVAGDHRDTSSIQGALVSGTRVAAGIIREAAQMRVVS